jgi:hypothetical protein
VFVRGADKVMMLLVVDAQYQLFGAVQEDGAKIDAGDALAHSVWMQALSPCNGLDVVASVVVQRGWVPNIRRPGHWNFLEWEKKNTLF